VKTGLLLSAAGLCNMAVFSKRCIRRQALLTQETRGPRRRPGLLRSCYTYGIWTHEDGLEPLGLQRRSNFYCVRTSYRNQATIIN
jgi:hypothetical protein